MIHMNILTIVDIMIIQILDIKIDNLLKVFIDHYIYNNLINKEIDLKNQNRLINNI